MRISINMIASTLILAICFLSDPLRAQSETASPSVEAQGGTEFTVTEGDSVRFVVKFNDATPMGGLTLYFVNTQTRTTYNLGNETRSEKPNGDTFGCNHTTRTCYLEISSVSIEEAGEGNIKFQAVSRFSSPSYVYFTVHVIVPPRSIEIIGGAEVTVTKGVSTNITCKVQRVNPVPNVYWLVGGSRQSSNLQVSTKILSGSDKGLHNVEAIVTFTPASSGVEYECHAEGTPKFAKTTTILQYHPIITMMTNPPNAAYIAGESFEAVCNSDAVPAVTSWGWTIGDTSYSSTDSGTTSTIDITVDKSMNSLSVTCSGTNSVGVTSASNTLNIHYPPEFTSTLPINHPADIGDELDFECNIDGNPDPTVIWSKVTQDETGAGAVIMSGSMKYSIPSVTSDSFGQYKCQGVVRGFPTIEHTFYVLRKVKPAITSKGASTSQQGRTAELVCTAYCIPTFSQLIWTKVGQPNVNLASHSRFRVNNVNTTEGVVSKLIIDNVVSTDYGDYNCTIINELGQDTRIFQLIQDDSFPWLYVSIGIGAAVALVIFITLIICCCRKKRSKNKKTSSAASLSEVSNGTENSIKKPGDGHEITMDRLPEESGIGRVDNWRTDPSRRPANLAYGANPLPDPSFYAPYRDNHRSYDKLPYSSSTEGSYRVQDRAGQPYYGGTIPQYSTLPLNSDRPRLHTSMSRNQHPRRVVRYREDGYKDFNKYSTLSTLELSRKRYYPDGMENPPNYPPNFPDPPQSFLQSNV